jgi:hypothetical protein
VEGDAMRWVREHGLVVVNVALFVLFLAGMTFTGWQVANDGPSSTGMP